MRVRQSVVLSLRYINDYKLRSTLTSLGLVIGVATIIVFVILSAGLQASVLDTVTGGSQDVVYVTTKLDAASGPPVVEQGGAVVFTDHDTIRISELDGVAAVVPFGRETAAVGTDARTVDGLSLRATTPAYFTRLRDDPFVAGTAFSPGRPEVVVNQQAAALYEGGLDVGDQLTVTARGRTVDATVAGVVADAPSVTQQLAGEPPRPAVYGPTDPFYQRTVQRPGTGEVQRAYPWLFVIAETPGDAAGVQGRITVYLAESSDARAFLPRGSAFSVTTFEEWAGYVDDVTATFVAYAATISLVSLLVGATGIANIMLVSVTGRFPEIGLMRAIGAQRRDILGLFLTEAGLIGVLGSGLGVGAGLAVGWLATRYLDVPFTVDVAWLGLAFAVGIAVSLLAGAYPAWRAAQLDPVDALRRE